jgi:hypothetical protein
MQWGFGGPFPQFPQAGKFDMMPNQWINPQPVASHNQQAGDLGGKNKGPCKSVQKKKGNCGELKLILQMQWHKHMRCSSTSLPKFTKKLQKLRCNRRGRTMKGGHQISVRSKSNGFP